MLDLRGNSIATKGALALAHALRINSTLLSLDMSENTSMDDKAGLAFAEMLKENKTLRHLNVSQTGIKTSALTALAIVAQNHSSLTMLMLAHPLLHSLQEETTTHWANTMHVNSRLRVLDLSHAKMRDDALAVLIASLYNNDTLQVLNLSGNQITIAGGEVLGPYLQTNKSLLELDLSWNRLDAVGGACIAKALAENRTLQILNLASTSLSNSTLVQMASILLNQNHVLQRISVLNNKYEQAAMQAFYQLQQKSDMLQLDIVVYMTDATYYVAIKKECQSNALLNEPRLDEQRWLAQYVFHFGIENGQEEHTHEVFYTAKEEEEENSNTSKLNDSLVASPRIIQEYVNTADPTMETCLHPEEEIQQDAFEKLIAESNTSMIDNESA